MISQTEAVILTAIRAGLTDIRKNLFLLDDAYSQFVTDPLLKQMYGKQPQALKEFVAKTQISIVMETRLPDVASYPAIVINVGEGSEDQGRNGLGDTDESNPFEDVDAADLGGAFTTPTLILGPVTPESYDKETGEVTFPTGVSLQDVYEGMAIIDEVNHRTYSVLMVMDDSTLLIDTGLTPNFTNCTIRMQAPEYKHQRKSLFAYESFKITSLSTDPNELMHLHTLVMYILGRYKKTLFEQRNFEISTINYGPVVDHGDGANSLHGRDIGIRGRVKHSFIESTDIKVTGLADMLLIDPTVEPTRTPDALQETVQAQGWKLVDD